MSTESEMPRTCKNGGTVPIPICMKKDCWKHMHNVCHPEQITLIPAQKYPPAKIIYGLELRPIKEVDG